jgi:hypothetical protein
MRLSAKEMLHDCSNQLQMKRRVAQAFRRHPLLEICYEELARDMARVQDFLEVPAPALALPEEKVATRGGPPVVVENEAELRRAYGRWVDARGEHADISRGG